MLRSTVLLMVFAIAAYSTAEIPSISDTDSPPVLRDFPDRPEKDNPPSIADRSYSPPVPITASMEIPRQELPEDEPLELQTSDACDSADMVRLDTNYYSGEKK